MNFELHDLSLKAKNITDKICDIHKIYLYDCQEKDCTYCKYINICTNGLICGQCQITQDDNLNNGFRTWRCTRGQEIIKELNILLNVLKHPSKGVFTEHGSPGDINAKINGLFDEIHDAKRKYRQYDIYTEGVRYYGN